MRVQSSVNIGIINRNRHFDGGRGTIANPYRIAKIRHLDNMRNYPNAHYVLINDITFTNEFEEAGEYYNDGRGWIPISTFWGSLNGQGYSIYNLKTYPNVNQTGGLYTTLVGTVENLKLRNILVDGLAHSFLGAVAGNSTSASRIEAVYVDGTIRSSWRTGGILGRSSSGSVKRCGVNITLRGSNVMGGIFAGGSSICHIHDCYSRGTMTNLSFHRGGVYGSTFGARLQRCFSAMDLRGVNNHLARGLISAYDGYNATQEDGYWDREATGTASSFAGGTPLFTVEAKYPYQEINGEMPYKNWDFSNVWAHDVDHSINDGYPYLRGVTPGGLDVGQEYWHSYLNFLWDGEYEGDNLKNRLGETNIAITGKDFSENYIPSTSNATFAIDGTKTVNDLVSTDYPNILVKYDNEAPHNIRMIAIILPELVGNLTQQELDTLHEIFDLWVWWSGDWNDYGVFKENRSIDGPEP